jgi:hypothetical protein
MAAELQKLADAETLHVSSFCDSAPASALKRLVSEARLETRIQSLTLVLERLWLFYEARRCAAGSLSPVAMSCWHKWGAP